MRTLAWLLSGLLGMLISAHAAVGPALYQALKWRRRSPPRDLRTRGDSATRQTPLGHGGLIRSVSNRTDRLYYALGAGGADDV
jgi:hypothetical protein